MVDYSEKRRAIEKFDMGDSRYHEYYKIVLRTMKKGETCWVKFGPKYHGGNYHRTEYFLKRTEEQKAEVGD